MSFGIIFFIIRLGPAIHNDHTYCTCLQKNLLQKINKPTADFIKSTKLQNFMLTLFFYLYPLSYLASTFWAWTPREVPTIPSPLVGRSPSGSTPPAGNAPCAPGPRKQTDGRRWQMERDNRWTNRTTDGQRTVSVVQWKLTYMYVWFWVSFL